MSPEEDYKDSFGLSSSSNEEHTEKALEHALDIRKFEISLYWQRATYFWTLIAATFAGYFAVLAADNMVDRNFNAYIIASVGFIFSVAWFLTNRGSKYWQENWENHVDMLEDKVTGPLYKTILYTHVPTKNILSIIEGPAPYSVSQINQWVSLFTIFVWVTLIFNVFPEFNCANQVSIKHIFVGVITMIAAMLMVCRAKSNIIEGQKHLMSVKRNSVIGGEN